MPALLLCGKPPSGDQIESGGDAIEWLLFVPNSVVMFYGFVVTAGYGIRQKFTDKRHWPRLKRLFSEAFWVGAGQCAAAIGGLVGVRLMTSLMAPAAYGRLALAMTAVMLLVQILFQPLSNGCTRFFSFACDDGSSRSFLSILRILFLKALLLTGVFTTLFFCVRPAWGGANAGLILCAVLFAVFNGLDQIFAGLQSALRNRKIVAFHSGASVWSRFLLAYCLMRLTQTATETVAMAGYGMSALLVALSQGYFFKKHSGVEQGACALGADGNRNWQRELLSYTAPLALYAVFTWGQASSSRWALQTFVSTADVGIYSVLFQLGYYPMTLLFSVILKFSQPILFSHASRNGTEQSVRYNHHISWFILVITLGLTGLAWVFSEMVFKWLTPSEYWSGAPLLPVMVLAGGITALMRNTGVRFMIEKQMALLAYSRVLVPVMSVGLLFWGAARFGLRGVVWSRLLISLLMLSANMIIYCRLGKKGETVD